jgi:hypothetical protein
MASNFLTTITTHQGDALAQLANQYRNRPLSEGYATGAGARAQTLETVLWAIYTTMGISPNAQGFTIATGQQLDLLGKLLGLPRGPASDALYVLLLQAQILVLFSNGSIPQITAIFELLLGTGNFTLTEYFPCAIVLFDQTPSAQPNLTSFLNVLLRAKAAGIQAFYQYLGTASMTTVFRYDTAGQGYDQGLYSTVLPNNPLSGNV